jgi:hypothetical protein
MTVPREFDINPESPLWGKFSCYNTLHLESQQSGILLSVIKTIFWRYCRGTNESIHNYKLSWVRPRTPGDTLPRLFGKRAGEMPSSLLESKHTSIYPGSGRERGSRVKPYIQHVWAYWRRCHRQIYKGVESGAWWHPTSVEGYILLHYSISYESRDRSSDLGAELSRSSF